MRFAARDRVTAAHQWWKIGDHPDDGSELTDRTRSGRTELTDGKVVQRYRPTDVVLTDLHSTCGAAYEAHGFIADGEHLVCPGDWIVGKSTYRVFRENMHGLSYEPEVPGDDTGVETQYVMDCRDCDVRLIDADRAALDAAHEGVDPPHVVDEYEVEIAK